VSIRIRAEELQFVAFPPDGKSPGYIGIPSRGNEYQVALNLIAEHIERTAIHCRTACATRGKMPAHLN
jgi:hypothetical protein